MGNIGAPQAEDEQMMHRALAQARAAARQGEVPVGALLVDGGGRIIAEAGNSVISSHDPTAHAEILALRAGGQARHNYRLPGTTLYVTLEPCAMCAAAMLHARVQRLVFGATDPKTGAILSRYTIGTDGRLNHTHTITPGVLAGPCSKILRDFFRARRGAAAKIIP